MSGTDSLRLLYCLKSDDLEGSESGFMFLLGLIYSLGILRGGVLVEVTYLLGKVLLAKQSIKTNFPSLGKWHAERRT